MNVKYIKTEGDAFSLLPLISNYPTTNTAIA